MHHRSPHLVVAPRVLVLSLLATFAVSNVLAQEVAVQPAHPRDGGAVPALAPRAPLVKPERAVLASYQRTDAIAVKFQDGLPLVARDGRLVEESPGLDARSRALVERFRAGQWFAVSPLPRDEYQRLLRRAEANLGRRIADLSVDFVLLLPAGEDARAAIDAFNALEDVELARGVPLPPPEPALATAEPLAALAPPDFQTGQGYLHAAPDGVDAGYAWDVLGTRGAGVRLADVEYDFNEHHEDLPDVTVLGLPPISPFGNDHHGTASLGEVFSQDDGVGTTGIAPDADAHFAATYPEFFVNVAGAILQCVATFDAGDVVMIEAQTWGPLADPFSGSQFGLVPVEWEIAEYSAIQMAVALGVTVVAAGANGSQNLDDPLYSTGNGGHWPFLPENDSGSIIVGAGHAPSAFGGTDVDRSRRWFTSHGSRVNLQGWGEKVWTTGYGDAHSADGSNAFYTSVFGGTSSATPIVAGACVLLQSAHLAHFGVPLSPAALRDVLAATGSPQQAGEFPATDHIGPRPDVRAAAEALGLAPFAAIAGCAGNPLTLTAASSAAVLGAPLVLALDGGPSGPGIGWLFAGPEATAPSGCGLVLPGFGELLLGLDPAPWSVGQALTSDGAAGFTLPLPAQPAFAGLEVRFQGAHASFDGTTSLSGGLRARLSL